MFEYPRNIKACYEPATYCVKSQKKQVFKYYFCHSISYITRYARKITLVLFLFLLIRFLTMAFSINDNISMCDVSYLQDGTTTIICFNNGLINQISTFILFVNQLNQLNLISAIRQLHLLHKKNLFWHQFLFLLKSIRLDFNIFSAKSNFFNFMR